MQPNDRNRCVFYNPRHFPSRKEIAALYLYFDSIDVVPPAQNIFNTHYLGNRFSSETGLDVLANLYHEAEGYESLLQEIVRHYPVRTYSPNRMSVLGSITMEMWQYLVDSCRVSGDDLDAFLETHDSIVSSMFHAAGRDLVLSNVTDAAPTSKTAAMSQAAFTSILPSLPAVVSDDLDLLQEIKTEFSHAVASFKDMLRGELTKFDFGAESRPATQRAEIAEFTASVGRHIDGLRNGLHRKIAELAEKRSEIKYKITFTGLGGLALGLVSNPAVGLITTLLGVHHFAQEWETLRKIEEAEKSQALAGAAGLFLKFDELEDG